MPDLDYSILGPITVRHMPSGEAIPLADKPELVLGRLLVQPGERVTSERLLADVWDGANDKRNTVQQTVARLRSTLGDAGRAIERDGTGYRLMVSSAAIDAERFRLLARGARDLVTERPQAAHAMLSEALSSWRGPLLGDHAELPWARGAARELEVLRANAEVDLNDVLLALGEYDEVEVAVRRQLQEHELDERRHRQLILALIAAGRNAEATDAYLSANRALVQPGPQLRALRDALGRRELPSRPPVPRRAPRAEGRSDWVLLHARIGAERPWDPGPRGSAVLAVEQAGGDAYPVGDDQLAAIFPGAKAAEEAAVALAGDVRLECRVGVHVGATVPVGEHLLGPGPARCRLLADAAHPGQILVSAAAQARASDREALRPLGRQRYEDLLTDEEAFELPVPDHPDALRLPQTLSRHPHNLPVQSSRFVGRGPEIAGLSRLVAGQELITLTGPGGCGKTRLALQVAARQITSFPDGVWFAGLADLPPGADAEIVATSIASAVGARPVAGEMAADALRRHLSDRATLLLIDNCEHVVDACAGLVADLLAHAPGTCVLTTSIAPLGLGGERVVEVPSMATGVDGDGELPDAVELLLERAGSLPSVKQRDGEVFREAGEICTLLDGLPLAIELAAAQVAQRGLAGLAVEIAAMLEGKRRLASLSSRDPTSAARHLTIEAAIDWGHRLLTPRQQEVFRRLAVFRGSFGLEEAHLVVAGDDVIDVIWTLVRCSMVASQPPIDGVTRLRLRSPIRAFAHERLEEVGETAEIRRRHTAVYGDVAARRAPDLFGAAEDATLRALEADHDNFRAALAHLVAERRAEDALRLVSALWWLWFSHGHFEEGGAWVDAALALDGTPSHSVVRALRAASHLSWWRGAYDATQAYNFRLEACAGAIDDAWGLAWAPMGHGAVLMFPHPDL
ncbi:MAG: winged helix-turn-helix domain-containing protein, partial [Solirubrobacteraceae bacterium]|nr:winged helix-turn-helix domain-containing protein [Solirubrobacteraceae bacterium]